MPVAKVYLPEGILTPDQRREIVGEFTMSSSASKKAIEFADLCADQRDSGGDWGATGTVYVPRPDADDKNPTPEAGPWT